MARSKTQIPASKSWMLPPRELADIMALKAMASGTANPDQQKRAYNYIVTEICGLRYWPYDQDSERDTQIALGKQFVGHTIVKFVSNPPELFVKQETGK